MIDVVLLFGKLLLLALMYLFLFAAVRAGLGAVTSAAPKKAPGALGLAVTRGPKEMVGVKVPVTGRVVIGRAADADFVIADDFVSTHHAAVSATGGSMLLEDLGSTNGTLLNGHTVVQPTKLSTGDVIEIGRVALEVRPL